MQAIDDLGSAIKANDVAKDSVEFFDGHDAARVRSSTGARARKSCPLGVARNRKVSPAQGPLTPCAEGRPAAKAAEVPGFGAHPAPLRALRLRAKFLVRYATNLGE